MVSHRGADETADETTVETGTTTEETIWIPVRGATGAAESIRHLRLFPPQTDQILLHRLLADLQAPTAPTDSRTTRKGAGATVTDVTEVASRKPMRLDD